MSELDKITTDVPPSTVPMPATTVDVPTIKSYNDNLLQVYRFYGADIENSYKKGTIMRMSNDLPSSTILTHIVSLYIDTVRVKLDSISNEQERKERLVQLKKVHNGLVALIDMLNIDDFKLDINSVVHIIHGYISSNAERVFDNYEIRRRTTHRHNRDTDNKY